MDSIVQALGIYAATLIVGVLSGLIFIVNGEIFLVGIILATDDLRIALVLALLMAIGQMIAKIILYKAALKVTDAPKGRFAEKLAKARDRVEKWKNKPLSVTFLSAIFGLPPFYIVTLVAGILRVRFISFLWLGITGRVIRFVAIALIVTYA
jgi:membrane protein YqaA with SNARE-associated domain